jgi:hypothetical protein
MGTSNEMARTINSDIETIRLLKADLIYQREHIYDQLTKVDELLRSITSQERLLEKASQSVAEGLCLFD